MLSRKTTLKRGVYSLIHEYSSVRASTSEPTTTHSTPSAVWTICRMRGESAPGFWK